MEDVELRVVENDDGSTKLEGYAAVFNKWSSNLGGFKETIERGAFTEALEDADVRGLVDHDAGRIIGRTAAGTMRLTEDKRGLKYSIDLPDTTVGRDIATSVRRGDISGSSFAFRVFPDGDTWAEKKNVMERTITKVSELFDVGPVTYPAYPDTTVATRSLDEWKASQPDPDNALAIKVRLAEES